MYFISTSLLNTYAKTLKFYRIIQRLVNSSIFESKENMPGQEAKPKQKIVITKRKIDNKQTCTILEWKSAADVIKKLNYENTKLFGRVQTTKNSLRDFLKSENINPCNIIQHETRIPIVEPDQVNDSLLKKEQKLNLHSILAFPLLNKCVHSMSKINEVNYLRKQLEYLCEKSKVPSVTSILQATMPKERIEILNKWKQNMINELGKEGFEKYQAELFSNGAALHHTISSFLSSTPVDELYIKEENAGHWKSLKQIFPNIKQIKLLEEFVTHPFLCYRGVVDCFATYKDNLVVIDWKTSKKTKALIKHTYDDPLQIAAYVGALNFDPKFQYLASKGLIVIAYESGQPATPHFIDEANMRHYWYEWLKRVKQYWETTESEQKIS